MVQGKYIIRMVALASHQHHALNVCIMLQVAGQLRASDGCSDSKSEDSPICFLVTGPHQSLIVGHLCSHICFEKIFPDGMSPDNVRCLMGESCCPESGICSH